MGNIYDVASAIQQPNVVGNFNQGVQIGQQNQVFGQKQAAYQQALGDQQNIRALAPQVIAGDPNAYSQVAAIDPNEATQLQGAGDDQLRRLSGAIQYIDSQQSPAAKEAAYQQAVKPYLTQMGQASGKVPPSTFAEAEPMMDAARAQIAQLGQQKSDLINVGAGGTVFDPKTRQAVYTNPGVAPKPQLIQTADGSYVWATPGAGATPLTYGGGQPAPQGQPRPPQAGGAQDPMTAIIAQANLLVQHGVPDAQVQQFIRQQAQQSGIQMGPHGADQQAAQGAPVMAPQKAVAPDTFAKNKEFADKLQAAGAITTPQEYNQVLTTGKLQQSDSDVALSPSDEAVAKGVATYAVLPSSLGRSKNRAAIIAHALEINPDYTEANAKGAYTYINDLSKSGTTSAGGQVQSINTGLNHLGTLMRANGELSGTDFPLVNRAKNFASTETGGTAANNWKQATYLFSQEMAKLVKGGVANEGEVRDIVGQLDASLSPEQRAQAIQHAAEFMYGRIQSVEDRGDRVLGSLAPNVSLMTKEAQDNLRAAYHLGGRDLPDLRPPGDLKSYLRQLRSGGASAQSPTVQSGEQGVPQSAQPTQAQPRAVNSMGHAVVWNGSAWVPE